VAKKGIGEGGNDIAQFIQPREEDARHKRMRSRARVPADLITAVGGSVVLVRRDVDWLLRGMEGGERCRRLGSENRQVGEVWWKKLMS